jgi:hypothetical protein
VKESPSEPPGFNDLAAFIVASGTEAAVEGFRDLIDVEPLIDEGALMKIAKEELEKGFLMASQAVAARVQHDLTGGLNS